LNFRTGKWRRVAGVLLQVGVSFSASIATQSFLFAKRSAPCGTTPRDDSRVQRLRRRAFRV
jgi:hypothetical protein